MRPRALLPLAVCLVVGSSLTACGGDSASPAAAPSSTTASTASPSPSPSASTPLSTDGLTTRFAGYVCRVLTPDLLDQHFGAGNYAHQPVEVPVGLPLKTCNYVARDPDVFTSFFVALPDGRAFSSEQMQQATGSGPLGECPAGAVRTETKVAGLPAIAWTCADAEFDSAAVVVADADGYSSCLISGPDSATKGQGLCVAALENAVEISNGR